VDKYKTGVHPDFARLVSFPALDLNKTWLISLLTILGRIIWFFSRPYKGIKVSKHKLEQNGVNVKLEYFTNQQIQGKRPCMVYYHGGGFVLPAFDNHKKAICEYMLGAGCDALFVDYSLSPKAKSQQVLAECYESVDWLMARTDSFNIDPNKIVIAGDSAGGCLTASVTQMMADKMPSLKPCLQLMVYPVLDDALDSASIKEHWQSPVWSGESTEKMWQTYLSDDTSYAVPMHREDLSMLPPAYIDNAEFDPLRDDASKYAKRLQEQGVSVEFHAVKQALHGYDTILKSPISQAIMQKRIAALQKAFSR